jgi:hypothetical protein
MDSNIQDPSQFVCQIAETDFLIFKQFLIIILTYSDLLCNTSIRSVTYLGVLESGWPDEFVKKLPKL